MKPVSYQSMPPSVNGGHPSLAIDRVLTNAKVMYCEKCGFATTDVAVLMKHRTEHMEMKFFCFYCNNVSFSEAELNVHLKQHTSKYPFACPHCGQGYMRKLCLVKHIERLHSKSISQAAAKSGTTKIPHVSVSGSLQSVPAADSATLPPVVRVSVPKPSAPAVRLGRDEQRGKTLDSNVSHATNGKTELLPPFNGLIQQSRALTVPLPEEVNIPAGCLVELVEVRTVNGTKELKLRLVSQQESESVIKDTRTVSENTPLGRPLPSTFSHPNTANSVRLGTCTVNRKPYEVTNANVALPSVAPANINKNLPCQVSKEKIGLKRPSDEIIDLERNSIIPNKVPNSIFNTAREGSNGIKFIHREPVSQNAAVPTVTTTRAPNRMPVNLHPENRGACVSLRNNLMPLQNGNPLPQKTVELKSVPREVLMAAKLEPRVRTNHSTSSNMKKEAVGLSQQSSKSVSPSLSVSSSSAGQLTPALNLVCKEKFSNLPLPSTRATTEPTLMKTPVLSNGTYLKTSARTQDVRLKAKDKEPETFPVISSVFSLSQQPENVQGSIRPLMAALRGIAMSRSCGNTPQDHSKIANCPALVGKLQTHKGSGAQVSTKNGFLTHNPSLTPQKCEPIKVEEPDKGVQPLPVLNQVHIKEENKSTPTEDKVQVPDLKPLKDEKCVSKTVEHVHAPAPAESVHQMQKSEHNISTKFLTVSLKRVQVGVWKKSRKGLKLRISKCKTQGPIGSLSDCAVLHLMPLKEDQLVKQPRANQPVVVLNHPRPRASVQAARVDTLSDRGAPKCQILKMRLSKVMGQKYEVMGCTVGVFS
ncbi:uncharacterized protein znf518b [Halichoeres trimaculatus]|uniref:uncharacterized protein znf518b n=1 Tax=Halichoeres trimaculatus TaxID=147232 RepID=UPI003D9EE67B